MVGDRLGRKNCIYVGALLQAIGAILQASSFGVPHMIVGRIVWQVAPRIDVELVPSKTRGRHVAIEGNLIAFGIVIAYYFTIGMTYASGPIQWRLVIAAQLIIIFFQVIWTMNLPESPRWLTARELYPCLRKASHLLTYSDGRHEEAIHVLAQLTGKDVKLDDASVIKQKKNIDDAIALERADGVWKFSECFRNGPLKIRRRFIFVICLQAMQQLSGINVLVYYMPHTLTTDVGLDYRTSLHVGAGLADTYWIFSFIGVFWLDRMGRRWPLIWGAIICGFSFLLAGILQATPSSARAKASLTFFFLYEAVFAIGWLPIPWLYGPEIMPLRHRTHSAALSAASDWIFNYLIVQITPIAIANIRWKTYLIFFFLNIFFALMIWLFYPETSGRTLEEMDTLFMGDNDRLIVINKKGRLLPGFRSYMNRTDNPEMADEVINSSPASEEGETWGIHAEKNQL
ncbi:hypothetical protein LTR99_010394 [Exophiala xenobiotica]|nr:hypothetical protein LTR92_007022 [Exophiala xenobiotica]KAK5530257.1 hypothetical protein LTR23_010415 [Chaetothyriales sp. CCFEE 6169]KAK5219375.1 hypothetical protein LTR72_007759 [Exophiala xenobiotica]KAK5264104.1 hypothetical protein LTR96_010612 [Exophiala xenobiotica]KAK5286002.1 hypothetical protein LTR14_010523 [Exophiala xenobiotica]